MSEFEKKKKNHFLDVSQLLKFHLDLLKLCYIVQFFNCLFLVGFVLFFFHYCRILVYLVWLYVIPTLEGNIKQNYVYNSTELSNLAAIYVKKVFVNEYLNRSISFLTHFTRHQFEKEKKNHCNWDGWLVCWLVGWLVD